MLGFDAMAIGVFAMAEGAALEKNRFGVVVGKGERGAIGADGLSHMRLQHLAVFPGIGRDGCFQGQELFILQQLPGEEHGHQDQHQQWDDGLQGQEGAPADGPENHPEQQGRAHDPDDQDRQNDGIGLRQ